MKKQIYLSHPVRGFAKVEPLTGSEAPNIQRAVFVGRFIRKHIPGVEVYIPGEHQSFVSRTYVMGMLTDKQILEVDCQILTEECQYIVFYNPQGTISEGMEIEKEAAATVLLPTYTFQHFSLDVLMQIRELTL